MYSILISLIVAAAVGAVTGRDFGLVWGMICALGAALLVQLLIGLWIRKKIGAINNKMQEIMQSAQYKINRQMQLFQQRPGGNLKFAQQTLERLQNEAVQSALAATEDFNAYYRWNPMLRKQINTMKMQLYFQIKDFGKVDELLKHCMLLDARSLMIKLVRMYKHNDPKLDKFYQRKLSRLKADDGALAACLYGWIKLRQEESEKALAALVAAKKVSDHPVLLENYERLVNGKQKHYSNSNFGDVWYSLYLEEPKMKVQQQRGRMMR